MTNNLPFTRSLLKAAKKSVIFATLLAISTTSVLGFAEKANANTFSQNNIGIETQHNQVDIRDVNNFFDTDTGYSEKFTAEEQSEIQKGWELKLRDNPDSATAIADFVMGENKGKRIPLYKNFNNSLTVKVSDTGETFPFVPKKSSYSKSSFKKFNAEILEKQYCASDEVCFVTLSPNQIDNLYYPAKGKNAFHDNSWEKMSISMVFSHEAEHLAVQLQGLQLENEEAYVIEKTNKSRATTGKPLRAITHNYINTVDTPGISKEHPKWDEKKYDFTTNQMIANIPFPENTEKWKQMEGVIIQENYTLFSKEKDTGRSPQTSIEELNYKITEYVEQNLGR